MIKQMTNDSTSYSMMGLKSVSDESRTELRTEQGRAEQNGTELMRTQPLTDMAT